VTSDLTPCDQLAQALSAYEQSEQDLETYRDKARKAEADEEAALTSEVYPEDEIAKRMGKAQNLKTVYATRIERKKQTQASQVSTLEATHQSAVSDFTIAINTELDKRRAAIRAKIIAAMDVDTELTPLEAPMLPQAIAALLPFCKPIRLITALKPSLYWGSPGDGPSIAACARALLANLEKFKLEISK
jgi:hypothetical protein